MNNSHGRTSEPHEGMNPVSPQLTKVRYLAYLPWGIVEGLVFLALSLLVSPWFYLGVAQAAVLVVWQIWLIPQQVKRLGWLETSDELLITRGKLWHTFTVVPYGRIQFVDVTAGPFDRMFGLKKVQLHTASATSDSTIQGLPAAEADALRERLSIKARERMSGL